MSTPIIPTSPSGPIRAKGKDADTSCQKGSELDAKIPPQGVIIAREFTGRWRRTFIEASVVTRRIHDLAADDGEVGSDHAARSPWRFAAHVVGRLSGSFTQLPLSPVQDRAALLKI
jgi:hypothetical protein